MNKSYFPSEVANLTKISSSTLRKYCILIEEKGYMFERRIDRSRIFYQQDIELIQSILTMILKKNYPLKQAITLCITNIALEKNLSIVLPFDISNLQSNEILKSLEDLKQMNQLLVKQLEQQREVMTKNHQLNKQIRELLK